MVEDKKDGMCVCENCPSFKDCGKKEKAFCVVEPKQKCITEANGCICGGCPLALKMGFKDLYYCLHGTEAKSKKKSK